MILIEHSSNGSLVIGTSRNHIMTNKKGFVIK